MKVMFENDICYIYNQHFGIRSDSVYILLLWIELTINLNIHFQIANLAYKRCNCLKSDSDDLEMLKLNVKLNSFGYEYGLPMTLDKGDNNNYLIMRDTIT
jgi:hypothetical protein